MTLDTIERWVRQVGGAVAFVALAAILWGLWRGLHRPKGRTTGLAQKMLRAPVYLLISVGFFGACVVLWRPLPLTLSLPARIVALTLGGLFHFSGLALMLWGRLALGRMYNVSSSLGAQLYAGHRLITDGPFALVRHPMYLGLQIAAFGGLLIYRTWTLVFLAVTFLGLMIRARREEQVLAAEFGEQWEAYCREVPAWIPRLRRQVR